MEAKKEYMQFTQPSLRVVETIGGYFRVIVFGPDLNRDNQFYSEMDIGRGSSKQDAIDQAKKWFEHMKDETPTRGALDVVRQSSSPPANPVVAGDVDSSNPSPATRKHEGPRLISAPFFYCSMDRACSPGFVIRHGFGDQGFDIADSRLRGRVCGEEFRRT